MNKAQIKRKIRSGEFPRYMMVEVQPPKGLPHNKISAWANRVGAVCLGQKWKDGKFTRDIDKETKRQIRRGKLIHDTTYLVVRPTLAAFGD